ncbi:hypothetical protein [Leeuwenhoekiella sp. MAR_2009_132]|uniref:hypothetical protein n=1 Tax=Leeuwenhoekiella sp. MAR_2009_132 TaxID=1392489 RepID=UPI00048EAAA3|nr:hypothetical protein [Leeuwenhoekiella sp. MAR_2009_132]
MVSKKFKTPLYGNQFTVILFKEEKEIYDNIKGFSHNRSLNDYDGCVFTSNGDTYLALNISRKGFPTPGIIAHEAKHLVNSIFIDIGHELCRYNDEPEAYLLGWIVNRIHELLAKNNEK